MKLGYNVDLASHLVTCEANYRRLRRLMPNVWDQDQWHYICGYIAGAESTLAIEVLDRARYTTTISLVCTNPLVKPSRYRYLTSYESAMSALWLESKNVVCRLQIRLYHDACLAEVVAMQQYRRFESRYQYPNADMHQADEQARLNSHLSEILGHCLKNGRTSEDILSKMRHSLT